MIYNIKNKTEKILISRLLQQNNINFPLPCGGNHTCGKCKIKVKGKLSSISDLERKLLTKEEVETGIRLACMTTAYSDIEVDIDDLKSFKILDSGIADNFIADSFLSNSEYGLAIDIGTTTVVACLLKESRNEFLSVKSELNMQSIYGADVISRITYSINHSNLEVTQTIVSQINKMIETLTKENRIGTKDIKYVSITGNTAMMHFFTGMDPKGIAYYPFTPESLFGGYIDNDFGLNLPNKCKIYIPYCISAYIGADLMCCVLSSNVIDHMETSIIVDIGTNGEMALYRDGTISCCSTAAGPAFEGANIKFGMTASDGAIFKVYYERRYDSIQFETINNVPAEGICGSGLVDALAIFLDLNIIDYTGRILADGHRFAKNIIYNNDEICFKFDDTDVYITQNDVRQMQLAKGAIAAGIETLLFENNVKENDVKSFFICGGFGTYLDLNSSVKIGLLPKCVIDRAVLLGNGALAGASRIILDKSSIEKINFIKNMCSHIELSSNEAFMNKYINHMNFHQW